MVEKLVRLKDLMESKLQLNNNRESKNEEVKEFCWKLDLFLNYKKL